MRLCAPQKSSAGRSRGAGWAMVIRSSSSGCGFCHTIAPHVVWQPSPQKGGNQKQPPYPSKTLQLLSLWWRRGESNPKGIENKGVTKSGQLEPESGQSASQGGQVPELAPSQRSPQ